MGTWIAEPPTASGLKAVRLDDKPKGAKKGQTPYTKWAQQCVLKMLEAGYGPSWATGQIGMTYQTHKTWERRYPEYKEAVKKVRTFKPVERNMEEFMKTLTFEKFVKRYFGVDLANHQKKIADALLDPKAALVFVIGFPEAGKSTLVGLWYAIYRMCQNPDIRILIVVANADLARKMLARVKLYLTQPHLYEETEGNLIEDFGGFEPDPRSGVSWTQEDIVIRHRKSGQRDPTFRIVGIGGSIYGMRCDLILMDDALIFHNQQTEQMRDKIHDWFMGDVRSRAQRGQVVINGTRVRGEDLYGKWMDDMQDLPTVRIVKIPAIENEGTDEERSAWPEMFPMNDRLEWDELRQEHVPIRGLRTLRAETMATNPDRWRVVYQQEDLRQTAAVFRPIPHLEMAYIQGADFSIGEVRPGEKLVLGVDPATSGPAASVLIAYDHDTKVRRVVDLFIGSRLGADGIRQQLLYQFWDNYQKYGVDITAVEINYWPQIRGDEGVMLRAEHAGTRLVEHLTLSRRAGSKRGVIHDMDYGIHSLAPKMEHGLIAFPSKTPQDKQKVQGLWSEMLSFPWQDPPGDALVALWIADSAVLDSTMVTPDQQTAQDSSRVPPHLRKKISRMPTGGPHKTKLRERMERRELRRATL